MSYHKVGGEIATDRTSGTFGDSVSTRSQRWLADVAGMLPVPL